MSGTPSPVCPVSDVILSEELVIVSTVRGGIVGLYFSGLSTSDARYRSEGFDREVAGVRQILAVRAPISRRAPIGCAVTLAAGSQGFPSPRTPAGGLAQAASLAGSLFVIDRDPPREACGAEDHGRRVEPPTNR